MRLKAERIATSIMNVVASWDSVKSVVIGENAQADVLDPYFSLVLDVYYEGSLPDSAARKAAFGAPEAFETRDIQTKDRFLAEDLPVRVEYKDRASVAARLGSERSMLDYVKDSGTYMAYRLMTGKVLLDRDGWVSRARTTLSSLGDAFWHPYRESCESRMEHYLNDLGASVMRDDPFFYQISLSGFLKHAAAALFAANRQFEASHRHVTERLKTLSVAPEGIAGSWDTLLRNEADLTPSRKYEVALRFARSVVQLDR